MDDASEERCVWLAQCVCPNGHCIRAYANEAGSVTEAKHDVVDVLHQNIIDFLRGHNIEPTCGACDARASTWRFCVSRTRFATMAEAEPHLLRAAQFTALRLMTAGRA